MNQDIDIDIHSLSAEEFKKYKLIDIREANELITHPSLIECPHVPLSELSVNKAVFDKNDRYLLFCAKGGRSHYLAEILNHEGHHALSVNNGIASVNAYAKEHGLA